MPFIETWETGRLAIQLIESIITAVMKQKIVDGPHQKIKGQISVTRLFEANPFVVAEIGSNWQTLQHCMESIALAKAVGADAVKFQAFNHEAFYGWELARRGDEKAELAHALPLEWLPELKNKADRCGIEFMCTAFSPEIADQVDLDVEVHKIASSDLAYPQLLKAVGKTGKPVILSTGASAWADVVRAVQLLQGAGSGPVVLMYCVSSYPARTTDLRVMENMQLMWSHVGFSDHTTDILGAPLEAVRRGAVVLEKHFTAIPHIDTPDRPHSLTSDEFQLMVDHIRGKRRPMIGPTIEEKAMVLRHNRRLVATQDVQAGETLTFGKNYGAFRSLEDDDRGMSPFLWNHEQHGPEGKRAAVGIARGKGIAPGDFG